MFLHHVWLFLNLWSFLSSDGKSFGVVRACTLGVRRRQETDNSVNTGENDDSVNTYNTLTLNTKKRDLRQVTHITSTHIELSRVRLTRLQRYVWLHRFTGSPCPVIYTRR